MKRKIRQGQCFQLQAAVSRVTTSPSMQLCSTTVERAGRKRTVLPVALRLHFSRDKTCWRRSAGEIRFPKRKAKRQGAEKRRCRAPTKGQRGGGRREEGGWDESNGFAATAANNYARNALIFAQLRKPITLSDATNFIPFLSLSDVSRDELPSCLENWILFISTIYCLRPSNARLSTRVHLFLRD